MTHSLEMYSSVSVLLAFTPSASAAAPTSPILFSAPAAAMFDPDTPAELTIHPQFHERPARFHALRERRGADIADPVVCPRRRIARVSGRCPPM
jgi:hypothetical protein